MRWLMDGRAVATNSVPSKARMNSIDPGRGMWMNERSIDDKDDMMIPNLHSVG